MKHAAEEAVVCDSRPQGYTMKPRGLEKRNLKPISICSPQYRVGACDFIILEVDLRVDGIISLFLYDEFSLSWLESDLVKDGFMMLIPQHDSINSWIPSYMGEDSISVMYISTQMFQHLTEFIFLMILRKRKSS